MSEFGLESDGYAYATPPPATRRNGPFLRVTTMLLDDTKLARSLDQEDGLLSQSTQSDDQSREPVPATSTPDLSFAASSSPLPFPTRESPAFHATNFRNVSPRSKLTSDHTFFVRRLDSLLQQAANQQCHSRTSDCMRIHLDSPEDISASESQTEESIGHDVVLESALGQREYNRCFSPSSLQQSRRYPLFFGSTPHDNTLATVPGDADTNSRRNKRKARAAFDEGSEASPTRLFRDGDPSDSYLSASDGGPPAPSRRLLGHRPLSKKRRCLSLDTQLSVVSPCAESLALSGENSTNSKSFPVQRQHDSGSNTIHGATEMVQFNHFIIPVSISFLSQDVTLSHSRISPAAGSVLSYPPTEPVTPVLGLSPVLSPVPVLGPGYFSQADIPHVFTSSDVAAGARLMSLLRKEVPYWREEGLGALLALDFAPPKTLEVITWILAVHNFPISIYYAYPYLERRLSHRWALQQLRRLGEGPILTIYMNN